MRLESAGGVDLAATLHSGQAFRWRPVGDSQEGFIRNRRVRLRTIPGGIEWEGDAYETDLRSYLRLDGTHERFLQEVARDEPLERSLQTYPGLRLLAQDPWEVFVSYILSANSNVAKIARTIELVCRLAGESVEGADRHRFPPPDRLARLPEAQLRSTGMGYRAPYVRGASRLVARGDLDIASLPDMSYDEAHAALMEAPGVGPKVADCILLYGCGHFGAFPIDVWIDRVLREEYFPRKRMNYRAWGDWARSHFGPWAGYAQHYLFHSRRLAARPSQAAVPRIRTLDAQAPLA